MLEPLSAQGVFVERPYSPSDLDISSDERLLLDPNTYPITVSIISSCQYLTSCQIQVTLRSEDPQKPPQVVYAKFVVGADGLCLI